MFSGTEFAIEAASERFDLKAELFRSLDRILPESAILATNTSSISITKLAAQTRRPRQVIGMHFFNPVPIMALVESSVPRSGRVDPHQKAGPSRVMGFRWHAGRKSAGRSNLRT